MTKNEIKKTFESRCIDAWNYLVTCSQVYGKDNNITVIERARWSELDNLYRDLFNESPRY